MDIARTGATIRPSVSLSKEGLKDYILNKVFLSLLDGLDAQDTIGAHDLVTYFHEINKSNIVLVSRNGFYIVRNCGSRAEVNELYRLSLDGDLIYNVTRCLVTDEMLRELNIHAVELQATILESELVTPTPRSQGENHIYLFSFNYCQY